MGWFLDPKDKSTWTTILRESFLRVFGIEHAAEDVYLNAIGKDAPGLIVQKLAPEKYGLREAVIAKRKLINPIKWVELLLTLPWLLSLRLTLAGSSNPDGGIRQVMQWFLFFIFGIPLGLLRRLTSPINTIVRPLKNLYQNDPSGDRLLNIAVVGALILFAVVLSMALTQGFSLFFLGGYFIELALTAMIGTTVATSTIFALTAVADVLILAGTSAKVAEFVLPEGHQSGASKKVICSLSNTYFGSNPQAPSIPLEEKSRGDDYVARSMFGCDS